MMNNHVENRERKSNFDLNKVDYDWIAKTSNKKELKQAYKALEEDGYFPDLLKTCGERICELDPAFRRVVDGERKMTAEEEKAVTDDLLEFLDTINKSDAQLRDLTSEKENQENKSIFSNGNASRENFKSPLVEQMEKQKIAENERMKGNECVKSKDFEEAVRCYSRSLELNPDEAFTFANRAMAHLKMKQYQNAHDDADAAIRLKPGYLKAHHRRGKALAALGRHEEAIKDFQYILEQEPDNKAVNKALQLGPDHVGGHAPHTGGGVEAAVCCADDACRVAECPGHPFDAVRDYFRMLNVVRHCVDRADHDRHMIRYGLGGEAPVFVLMTRIADRQQQRAPPRR